MAHLVQEHRTSHMHALAVLILAMLVLLVALSVRSNKPVPHYIGFPAPAGEPAP